MSARSLRRVLAASTSVALLLVVTAVALAAHVIKGATYRGRIASSNPAVVEPISFKVTANGKRVHDFTITALPIGCQGGAFGNPQPGSAAITEHGTFKATLKLYFAPAHRTTGKLVVTGTFLAHGKEKGKLSTVFASHGFSKSCDKSVRYSTTG
jgi:hypothetical protein